MKYLSSTFSPMMVKQGQFIGQEITLHSAKRHAVNAKSIVGHETTAPVLAALLGIPVAFNRENVALVPGDEVIQVTPNFRASEAREFTHEEVARAGYRAFYIKIT